MMLVVVALIVWCVLSVPATFVFGRLIAAHCRARDLPFGAQAAAPGHRLVGR